jgi:tagaturonate reductase
MDKNITFCNSLVDRIVTKDPGEEITARIQQELGYDDKLLTMCEDYRLWAIQGDDQVKSILTFTKADPGVFVETDIEIYKSLKLHLLNGTHTFSAGLAYLAGFDTVKEAMADQQFSDFVTDLMMKDISRAIPFPIPDPEKKEFGLKVLDRFRNPFLQHQWLNITFQCTTKMRMRNLPVLIKYQEMQTTVPVCMAVGFAAYILFMKAVKQEGGYYYGQRGDQYYRINDEHAPFFYEVWQNHSAVKDIVEKVLGNTDLWGVDLSAYNQFRATVAQYLGTMTANGVKQTIVQWHRNRTFFN